MNFTDKSIKALKAKDKRYVLTESGNYGEGRLQIRVSESGAKTFRVQYHINGKRKVIGLGNYPVVDLKTARSKHAEISVLLSNNIDPQEHQLKTQKAEFASSAKRTMLEMLDDFNVFISTRWAESTIGRTEKLIKRNITPFIATDLMPDEFTIDMARDIIYRVYNRGAKEQARLVRSTLMSILKYAIDFDNSPEQYKKPNLYDIKTNFIRDINFETPKNKGERWLSEAELKKVWNADDLPYYTQQYIKLALLLGGQRVNEVYGSYVSDFDLENKTFTIPANRIKVKQRGDHIVPLCETVIPIIQELMQQAGKAGQMFPHRDNPTATAHVSTIRMAILRWCEKNDVPPFNPRDLRRTCKTLMGKAGIDKINRDILQQHNKFDVSSVHYDRYDYMKEKKGSINTWENFIKRTI
ncbi:MULTISPECIES: tyrosine-type recombinase/integrase [unclassified Pseudoalteromonas]|uniref:tyrosine-type recombinase/integrase n=1 Tax=unclassified Pseudoalteromonas TaxID=194690 RepID=UPI0016012C49|nr:MULTISPECIES: site-specific integrase [unclassified Pseudoalteromonas]MBB1333898.1 integrase arm-type DNA-binding domain-containing protein [Pseudoalteromonas sp. SR41-6]MBB1459619.1 integrase arm-type DNA-binding domain-containing protein [Pseudoalteromonas sp. SG41-8]